MYAFDMTSGVLSRCRKSATAVTWASSHKYARLLDSTRTASKERHRLS